MSDPRRWLDAVLRNRRPMRPIPTSVSAQIRRLSPIRSVIFDIYGTLLISGSGDVGSADKTDRGDRVADAMTAVGLDVPPNRHPTIADLHRQIEAAHQRHRGDDCPAPEVDIVDVWRNTLIAEGIVGESPFPSAALVRLAAEYESLANPTWPMPGAEELLANLAEAGIRMGVVSNAQVFTVPLVEDLLQGKSFLQAGFDLDLCLFSNRFRHSKPGPRLFQVLRAGLARRGILPHEAIYVGNDRRNDVGAASQAGLLTAWFAGDLRSFRPRADDPLSRSTSPDVVLTHLSQLLDCL